MWLPIGLDKDNGGTGTLMGSPLAHRAWADSWTCCPTHHLLSCHMQHCPPGLCVEEEEADHLVSWCRSTDMLHQREDQQ